MSNRLAAETSPYLRQHAENPVDWYPWGSEALERARREDRPLLVSIGYSACHWCHVMAHECFQDATIAAAMNERFVCVKVDREERPDVDAVCMEACQSITGQGGWPLNCFLTPEGTPFFAGTYFPPAPRPGMPSWPAVLDAIDAAWRERRDDVLAQGRQLAGSLGAVSALPGDDAALTPQTLETAVSGLRDAYDPVGRGFGRAPKFPQASVVEFLLARGEREMALGTLHAMADGGIHDQVAGGFARYSVDASWTVPHFEKMLYDNALLARAYLHGFQADGDPRLRAVCESTLEWLLGEMRGPEGGFYSALDADSEGVEGRYYVWSAAELREVLGELAEPAIAWFGASETGNFEGVNVLRGDGPAPDPDTRAAIRARLRAARERRVAPGLDDKRLCAWNALTLSALADAGAALARPDYLREAVRCAEFLTTTLRGDDGLQLRTYSRERAHITGYLDDHAALLEAMLDLHAATLQPRWYREAVRLAEVLLERFADPERGGFLTTPPQGGSGFPRRRDLDDSPVPSGNASAAFGLLRLARLSGDDRYAAGARGVLRVIAPIAARHPVGFGHGLRALDFLLAEVDEVAVVGPDGPAREELLRAVRGAYRPHVVLSGGPGAEADPDPDVPLLRDRPTLAGRPAAYVCRGFACQAPVEDAGALTRALHRRPVG